MTGPPIGNNLRRLRFDQDEMSQAELARIVGVTRQTIVALETGRYAPSLELAMRLATVFGCSVDNLFHWLDADAARALYSPKSGDQND
jgi:putative transcriptional regulator